VSMRPSRPL